MKPLPYLDDQALLIRTDFSDEAAWRALHTAVTTPNADEFAASLRVVDDPAYADLTPEQITALAPAHSLLVLADKTALTTPERQLLVIDVTEEGSERLRVVADEQWSIENNISLGNMDWEDFADAIDEDGVFRGF